MSVVLLFFLYVPDGTFITLQMRKKQVVKLDKSNLSIRLKVFSPINYRYVYCTAYTTVYYLCKYFNNVCDESKTRLVYSYVRYGSIVHKNKQTNNSNAEIISHL